MLVYGHLGMLAFSVPWLFPSFFVLGMGLGEMESNRGVLVLYLPTIYFNNEGSECFLCGGKAG